MADNLDKLYRAVSAKFDIGDAEAFKAKMQTPEDRKKFYDVVSGKGFDLGDYNSYESRLGTTTSVQKKSPIQTGGEKSTVVAEQVTQPSKTNGSDNSLLSEANASRGIQTGGEKSTVVAEQVTQPSKTNGSDNSLLSEANASRGIQTNEEKFQQGINPAMGEYNQVVKTKGNPYDYIFSNQKKATEHLQTADAAGMDINYILKNEKVKTAQDLYTQIQQAPDGKTKKELTAKYEEFLKQPAAIDNQPDWEGSVNGRKVKTDDPLKGKTVGDAVEMVRAKQDEKNKNIDAYKNTHAETNDVIQKMRTAVGYSPDPDKGYKELDAVHNFFGSAGKTIDGMITGAQYMLADEAGRKQILKQKMMDQELYPEQAKDDNLTHISGMVGGVLPYIGVAATGGIAGTPGALLANSLGMGLTGYSNAAQEAYAEKFKETGNEDEAFKSAETMSKIGAGVGTAQGAALSLMPGGKLPTSVRDFIFKTGQKNAVLGGMFSGSRFLENKLAQMEGLDRESMSGVKESFVDGMLLGTVMDGLHYFPGKIGDATKGRFENILARYSFADVTQAVDNAVQAGVMDNASAQKVMAPIQEKAAAFSKMPDTMPFEKQETVLPLMVERNRLVAEKEKTAEAFHGGIDAKIEDIDRRIAEQSGSPLTSKERADFEKLQKRKGDPEDKLTSSESDLHDHYAAREKSNFAVNNIDETPQRVTYKDGRTGLLHKNSEGDIEFTPDGNSKAVVFDKGDSVNEKSIKQLGFTVESKNELARPNSQIVSGEVKVGGEVIYKGKRYSITENKNAPEGFKTDADGNVHLLYLKDENGQRIVVGADNADGVSLIADANKLIGKQETKPEVSLQEPVESKLKEETAPAAEDVVAAKDSNAEVVKEEVKPVVVTPVGNVAEGRKEEQEKILEHDRQGEEDRQISEQEIRDSGEPETQGASETDRGSEERKAEQERLTTAKDAHAKAEKEYNALNKALTDDLKAKQVGMFEGKEQKMFDDAGDMKQRVEDAKRKLDEAKAELDKAQDVVDANINGQKKLFGKDKVADGLNDLDNIVNENRIAEEYNDVREDAKNEYEKELDRHLEDLREAYSSASRTEAGLRKLQEKTPSRIGGFIKRLLTGTTPEDVVASKARLAEMQKQYRKAKADLRALLPRERGSNFVVEKLSRAARTGEISQETADLAIDLIKKNPDIFEDLAISITKKPSGNEGLQGWYRAADALVKVFKNPSDPTTAVHELLHHTERFLPHDIRDNIIKEWNKEVELQKDSLAKKLKNEKDVSKRQEITTGLLYLELAQARQAEPNYSNVVAMERIMSKYLGDHTDSQGNFHKGLGDSWYQLFNPSEWWAVNASRLFREAKNKPELKTWTDKAKAFYNYLIQSAKRIFKGSPTEAVEKGLKAVLDGQTLEDRQGSQLSTSKKLIGNSQNDAGLNQLIIPEKKPKVIDALARIGKGLIEAKEAKIDDVIEKTKAYVLSKSRNITEEDVEGLKGEILDKINIETISEEPLNAKNIDKAVAKKLKEETREAGRDLIRKRRASIDSENLKTELYAQSLEKQTTKEQREVLPFILEKTNVPEKLGRPDLVETLKNDKAELEPIAAQIREHFDKMWEKIVANTETLDAEQIKDYVTHIWDIPKDKTEQVANWFSTKNRFLNKRYISTIEEGVDLFGLKPKVLDIAQIIRIHDSVANTVIANGEFVTDLKTMSRDGMPLIIRADKSPEGWVTVDHPAMSSPLVIPGENGKANVVIKLPYKVHPDLAEPVKAIFGKKIDSKFLDNYMKADGVMKKIGLSASLFHHGALSETAIALMGPVKAVTAIWKLGKAAIVNKFEGTPLAQFPNEAVDAINHGVKFGHTLDINTGAVNGILEKIASKTKDIPVAGKAAELLSSFNEKWDTSLWNYLHDGLKLYAFMDAKTKMPENTANKKQYLQEHAQLINDYFGGQNWDVLLTSPRAQQIMRLALLSPDWTISKLRLAGAPVGLGAMSKDAKYVRAKASGMFWVKAAIYYGVGLNLMNAYFRKQDRKEHPEYYPEGNNSFMDNTMFGNTVGHKTHLFTGRYEDGSEMYRRWGKEFRELPELFMNEEGVSFPKPLLEKAGGKMAPAAQIVSKLMTGNSLGGYEDWDLKDKKGWAWTAGAMKVIAKGYTPMSTGNFFRDDKEWKPADLMFPGGKGMTKSKTIDLFKKGIDQGDEAYVKEIYSGAVRNNLDAYGLFKTAIQSSNAEKTKELMQGIKTVEDVKQKIRDTTDKEEKQKLFRKLRKFEIENKQKHQANKLWNEAEKELRD